MRARVRAPLVAFFVVASSPCVAPAAVKPGLEGAQELFRQNHWEEARAHLRAQWASLPEKDRPTATFLIGRAYVREAEFYRAAHRFAAEVGLAYLDELAAARANRSVAGIPLFKGLYQTEVGRNADADRTLLAVPATLSAEWKASARLRRALAVHRLGRVQEAAAALADPAPEARFCRLLAGGAAEPPLVAPKAGRREKLLTAVLLYRAGRAAEAEALLAGINLDLPDLEDKSDPRKLLRFHDPLVTNAWERICWERAVAALMPLAAGASGPEKGLAAFYAGLSLLRLGASEESVKLLQGANASSISPELQSSSRLLLAAATWKARAPTAADLAALWDGTEAQPDAVLLWDELKRGDLAKTEPFATKLAARLKGLLSSGDRPPGALVGRWGLARLGRGDDPGSLVDSLSEHRDKSNKNKLEWNDPLLLLALSAASYRDQEYPQALETLFELSKTFPGLRALQWNLQGIYAARQKAGGEARISQ